MAPFKQTTVPAHRRDPNYTTGRPSDYRTEYCEAVIKSMGKGYSLTAFAGQIRQSRDTIYEWIKRYSDFSDAVNIARSARVAALETRLLSVKHGGEAASAIFALKNADPTEWRDIRYSEHQHSVAVKTLTDDQLHAIAGGSSPADAGVIEGESERISEKPATR